MPWKECSVTQERLRFVARLLDGEGMSEVCRDFGISRKTGYAVQRGAPDWGAVDQAVAVEHRMHGAACAGQAHADRRPSLRTSSSRILRAPQCGLSRLRSTISRTGRRERSVSASSP